MDNDKNGLANYKELSAFYLKSLSGDRVLSYDIVDQNGSVIFYASETISLQEIESKISEGTKFYIPKVSEPSGSYNHNIISKKTLTELAKDTYKVYCDVRKNGRMSCNEYQNSRKHIVEIASRLKKEDRHGGILPLIRNIEKFDYYTYTHSVNVGIIAMSLFYKLGYPADMVQHLSAAGLLHDIGKLTVPQKIINKAGRLTSDEFISVTGHTRDGYRILDGVADSMDNKIVPETIKLTALFHHRKYKYRGYPFREKRDENSGPFYRKLPEEVRLIGICDMYDAITTETPFRKGLSHEEGMRHILNASNYHFLTEDVHKFLKAMALTLNSGKGFLSEGDFIVVESYTSNSDGSYKKEKKYEFAQVVSINKNCPVEPGVRIFYDATKNKQTRSIDVDLKKDYSRKIVRVLKNSKLKETFASLYK